MLPGCSWIIFAKIDNLINLKKTSIFLYLLLLVLKYLSYFEIFLLSTKYLSSYLVVLQCFITMFTFSIALKNIESRLLQMITYTSGNFYGQRFKAASLFLHNFSCNILGGETKGRFCVIQIYLLKTNNNSQVTNLEK